ncbi:MAG: type III pantothenate kinase [Chitinispirillales bacterium]|jgi:type III pantothenate kinase|nr:type III pantothenate kinase [Chitinispirillales bacterium]
MAISYTLAELCAFQKVKIMTRSETTVLAIDIGSTRTHIAGVDIEKLSCIDRENFNNTEFNELFKDTIKKFYSNHQISKINVTSCVKELAVMAKEFCKNTGIDNIDMVKAHGSLSVTLKYENPEQLGSDRICNALACGALFKNQSCVIIDCGTAVTIDYLHKGKIFEGGVIFAGSAAHAAALYKQTDALPNVIFKNSEPLPRLPAKSTEKCIAAGVLYAAAGAIDRCIEEYKLIYGNEIRLIAAGGGWEFIKPLVKKNHEITTAPDLTLIGAGIYRPC